MALLSADELTVSFGGTPVLDAVSFAIGKGQRFGIVGDSGAGKSVAGLAIMGLLPDDATITGALIFEGAALPADEDARAKLRGKRIAMVFQDSATSLDPLETVGAQVAEAIELAGQTQGDVRAEVDRLFVDLGLEPEHAARYPHDLSSGQRQRVMIAVALAGKPDLLICDEPTSALDVSVQAQILNLMAELQERLGLTYLFISHNLAVVSLVADRVGVMYLGRIVELAKASELFARPRHPYTRMLLDAVPDLGMTGKPRTPVAGEVPNPLAPPPGCAFHPRCPYANARCQTEVPRFANGVACHAVEEGRI